MDDARREKALALIEQAREHLTACRTWHHSEITALLRQAQALLAEPEPPQKTLTTVGELGHPDQLDCVEAYGRRSTLFRAWPKRRGAVVSVFYEQFPDALRGVGEIPLAAPLLVGSYRTPHLLSHRVELPGTDRAYDGRTAEQVFTGPDGEADATTYYNDKLLPTLKALAAYIEANFRLAPEE